MRVYRNAVMDNARWTGFEPRPDDIFVCTPSKCGTTWMQTIVANLLWPDGDIPGHDRQRHLRRGSKRSSCRRKRCTRC